jgi:hypothetical protein
MFTKKENEFMDWLDAVVEAELDLETTIQTDGKALLEDFKRTRKLRKEFFEWFKKNG